jgi:hypothetical protein
MNKKCSKVNILSENFFDTHKALTQLMKLHFQYLKYFGVVDLRLIDLHRLLFPSIFNQDTLITSLHCSLVDIRSEFMQ